MALPFQMMPGGGVAGLPMVSRLQAPQMEAPAPQDVIDDRDQPLYVNAKQYNRILKRRKARAKLEAMGKIPKERQVRNWLFTFLSFF